MDSLRGVQDLPSKKTDGGNLEYKHVGIRLNMVNDSPRWRKAETANRGITVYPNSKDRSDEDNEVSSSGAFPRSSGTGLSSTGSGQSWEI